MLYKSHYNLLCFCLSQSVQVDLSRDVEQKEYDLKRADRIIDELRDELNSCKQQLASTQVDGDLSSKKFNDMNTQLNLHKQRLMDAEAEVRALRETRATLQREIDMLNEVCIVMLFRRFSINFICPCLGHGYAPAQCRGVQSADGQLAERNSRASEH